MDGTDSLAGPSLSGDRSRRRRHVAQRGGGAFRGGDRSGRPSGACVRITGAAAAKPKGGDTRSHRIEAFRDVILPTIEAEPDVTLTEPADRLRREHGVTFARSTIWRLLDLQGSTFKNNRARQRAGSARHRGPQTGLGQRAA